jgi:hypothetical protein
MTPIEAMAKAHWAESENCQWEHLLPEDRAHMVAMMRAALLALAEVELPESAKHAGTRGGFAAMMAMDDHKTFEDARPVVSEHVFRAIIRSLAEDGEG